MMNELPKAFCKNEKDLYQIINNIQNISLKFNDEVVKLRQELSYVDQKLSDLDHFITFNKIDAIIMTKIIKARINLLKERREIKNEIDKLDHILDCIGRPSKIDKLLKTLTKEKFYSYKTNIIEDLKIKK